MIAAQYETFSMRAAFLQNYHLKHASNISRSTVTPTYSCQFSLSRVAFYNVRDLVIKTTKTKALKDTHLVSRTFKSETGERVIALLHVHGKEKESDHFTHEWVHTIERTLVHAEEPAYERMEGALKELNGLLKGTQIGNAISDVDGLIMIQDADGILHMSQAGRAEAYLSRKGKTVQITERAAGRSGSQFLYISSGDIEGDDTIIASTERLLRCLTPAQMTQILRKRDNALDEIRDALETEKEPAVVSLIFNDGDSSEIKIPNVARVFKKEKMGIKNLINKISGFKKPKPRRKARRSTTSRKKESAALETVTSLFSDISKRSKKMFGSFLSDLQHPTKKRRAHIILLASAIIVFIAIWAGFQVTNLSVKSKNRTELREIVEEINSDITTSENRHLMGDIDSASAILNRAEQSAKNIMQNESGLFRTEALDLLDRIREKRESISNIVRLSPTIVANLTSRNPDVSARGLIGIERGRMIAYDRQNLYSIIVNAVDEPQRLDGDNLILNGSYFSRYNTTLFMTKENRLIELIEGQPTAMKTDDQSGWLSGPDMETYIRFLYVLSPQNNQIYKYERLSNRYSTPTEYNVSGNMEGAIDMTIDASVYVLHQEGKITKLFRGEESNFTIRNLPEGALETATKIYKVRDRGNFYFLDPEHARIVVSRTDDDLGESLYLKQYVLEGEQIGTLQDLYIDQEETHLIVMDEKRIYSINLQD